MKKLCLFVLLSLIVGCQPYPGCTTDTECMQKFGGDGGPEPAGCPPPDDEWAADAYDPEFLNDCWGTP